MRSMRPQRGILHRAISLLTDSIGIQQEGKEDSNNQSGIYIYIYIARTLWRECAQYCCHTRNAPLFALMRTRSPAVHTYINNHRLLICLLIFPLHYSHVRKMYVKFEFLSSTVFTVIKVRKWNDFATLRHIYNPPSLMKTFCEHTSWYKKGGLSS